nr:GNAT family N-acetyltransferase [uncultured Lachnoanaerobaculum sp.]
MRYYENIKLKNNMACIIRNATITDAKGVLENTKIIREETDFLLSYPDEINFSVEEKEKFLEDKENSPCEIQICALVDDRIVGLAGISAVGLKEKVKHRAEFGISIEKAYYGKGIGTALTKACIDCAKTAGYRQLELEVVAENKNAIALYKKFGFKESGSNPRGFYSRYTGWQELISMLLELD